MCFEIVCNQDTEKHYDLMYIPGAKAVTDPPDCFWKLLSQRRRWINGSNAIFLHVISNAPRFFMTSHSPL